MQDSAYLDVNEHGVLRVPGPLWLGLALLARYWILMLVILVGSGQTKELLLLVSDKNVPWAWLLMELPIVLLMLAGTHRTPTAGRWARALWRHGRLIITLTATLNLAWTARVLWQSDDWNLWPELLLASVVLLDLAMVLAVWRDKFFRQLFGEFPAPAAG